MGDVYLTVVEEVVEIREVAEQGLPGPPGSIPEVSQPDAEAGISAIFSSWSPMRWRQAAAAWLAGVFGTTAGTVCQGDDGRLSNARQPTAHKDSHGTGGVDRILPLEIGALPEDGGTIADYKEKLLPLATLTADKSITLSEGMVQSFYINPAGASIALILPPDPGAYGKSFVLFVKNNTGKAHTWAANPAVKWVSEADSDTVPTPAAAGYVSIYTFTWDDNGAGTGRWFGWLAGKETA